jgi:hypothetical protein
MLTKTSNAEAAEIAELVLFETNRCALSALCVDRPGFQEPQVNGFQSAI